MEAQRKYLLVSAGLFCAAMLVAMFTLPPVTQLDYAPVSQPQAAWKTSPDCINLNTAVVEELCCLPGVGEVRAKRVIEYRTAHGAFQNVSELAEVEGFSKAAVQKLKPFLCV